jgi:hypothetical protein
MNATIVYTTNQEPLMQRLLPTLNAEACVRHIPHWLLTDPDGQSYQLLTSEECF